MRILHVVDSTERRGAQIFAADLVRALRPSADQQVTILKRLEGSSITFDAATSVLATRLNGRSDSSMSMARALQKSTSDWNPDVVLAHGGEALKFASMAKVATGLQLVYRRIGSAHHLVSRGVRKHGHRLLMRRAVRIVAVSEAVREETIRVFRVPGDRIVTIPNAVDPERFNPRRAPDDTKRSFGLPPEAEVVLFLGALTWEKHPLAAVHVAARTLSERQDAVFIMAGDGPLRGRVQQEIERYGLQARTRLLGVREDIPDLLAVSHLLLLTSRTEGMPASVIETWNR